MLIAKHVNYKMKDPLIEEKVNKIKEAVDLINQEIAELYTSNVEIRISYREAKSGEPASISLWKIEEHINYLE